MLDAKGRCCGKKPIQYKSSWSTSDGPHKYCPRCDRAYDLKTGAQIDNWAWRQSYGKWVRKTNKQESA